MSHTPAVCAADQADRADMQVLRALHMAAPSGKGADMVEVRDLLILCYGLTAEAAGQAIADAGAHGLIAVR